ncbi:MAG: hypothetical protein ACREQQ_10175 [Candidatus Binatia bacterium]
MKRTFRVAILGVLLALTSAAHAADVDINVNLGAPPPPAVFFDREPEVVLVPKTEVYYVPRVTDYDMYRVGPHWYVNRDGYWYRAKKYAGPFSVIEHRYVPRSIIVLPREYRRHPAHPHGGPPGQVKKALKHAHKHHKHKHKHK